MLVRMVSQKKKTEKQFLATTNLGTATWEGSWYKWSLWESFAKWMQRSSQSAVKKKHNMECLCLDYEWYPDNKKKARVKTVVQTWTLSHPNGDRWILLDYPCDTTPLYSHWNGMVIKNINRLLGQPKSHHPIVIPINRLMVDVYGNINGNQNPTGYLDKMQWGHGVSWQREYVSHVHCDHGPSKYIVPVGSIEDPTLSGAHFFVYPRWTHPLDFWVWGPNSCIKNTGILNIGGENWLLWLKQ